MSEQISTQNMSANIKSSISTPNKPLNEITPFPAKKRRVFTDLEREELKEIIKEALKEMFQG